MRLTEAAHARRPLADGRPVTDNPDEPVAFSDTGI